MKDFCNAHYIGWGVDTELFRPGKSEDKKYTFFHNAGWLGTNYRKMTPSLIIAFDAVSRLLPYVTLLIHAQAELEKLPPEVINIVRNNPRITYHVETVPAPGLYHAVWDLDNDRGEAVASGVYLFMVKVKGGPEGQSAKVIKKLAIVR